METICFNLEQTSKIFNICSDKEYNAFLTEFTNCICSNSWGLLFNGTSLFHPNEKNSTTDTIRTHILESPCCLIDTVSSRIEDSELIIYMPEPTPWFLCVNYMVHTKKLILTYSVRNSIE